MMTPEEKAEVVVAGWLSLHKQEYIPNGLNQLKAIIADAIEQERDRKVRGGPFVKVPDQYGRLLDLGRVTMMEAIGLGNPSMGSEVVLRWWFDDPTKHTGCEMSQKRAEEIVALWKERDRVPAEG